MSQDGGLQRANQDLQLQISQLAPAREDSHPAPSSKWEHHWMQHWPYHHVEQKKKSHDPRPNHHKQGEVSVSSIGHHDPPRTPWQAGPRGGRGAVCSRAPQPWRLPALPWSDHAVPGPCERSARTNTTVFVP